MDTFVFLAEISPSGPNKVATWYPECKRESPVFLYVQRAAAWHIHRVAYLEKKETSLKNPFLLTSE
jgi:hypothetical protein